jgi:hypothetical protein
MQSIGEESWISDWFVRVPWRRFNDLVVPVRKIRIHG